MTDLRVDVADVFLHAEALEPLPLGPDGEPVVELIGVDDRIAIDGANTNIAARVHTPHGPRDFDIWMLNAGWFEVLPIDGSEPRTVTYDTNGEDIGKPDILKAVLWQALSDYEPTDYTAGPSAANLDSPLRIDMGPNLLHKKFKSFFT